MRREQRGLFLLLGSLYLSQGLPFGFFTQALPAILREQGVSLAAIGASSLLALPWALKFLWAPAVDRVGSRRFGRRKGWIVPLQLGAAALMAGLAFADFSAQLPLLLGGVLVANLLAATQDVATDALAVEALPPEDRGIANGIQVAGYRVGMIVGGGLLLILYGRIGHRAAFLCLAGILLAATVPIVVHREPERPRGAAESGWAQALASVARRPNAGVWFFVLVSYKSGDALGGAMIRPLLVDRGYDLAAIGWLLGTVGFGAGLVGALAGGAALRWLSRPRALVLFGVAQAVAVALYVAPAQGYAGARLLAVVCAVEHFTGGMATAVLFTAMMDWSRIEHAATDYTTQACAVVVATGLASAVSGLSAEALGYTGHFVASAVASGAAALAAGPLTRRSLARCAGPT